jgi:hypothetical protein
MIVVGRSSEFVDEEPIGVTRDLSHVTTGYNLMSES